MIDKVAMAISFVDGFLSTRQCFAFARAAMEAMREPTEAMTKKGIHFLMRRPAHGKP